MATKRLPYPGARDARRALRLRHTLQAVVCNFVRSESALAEECLAPLPNTDRTDTLGFRYAPSGTADIAAPYADVVVQGHVRTESDLVRPSVNLAIYNLTPADARMLLLALGEMVPPGSRTIWAPVDAWLSKDEIADALEEVPDADAQ